MNQNQEANNWRSECCNAPVTGMNPSDSIQEPPGCTKCNDRCQPVWKTQWVEMSPRVGIDLSNGIDRKKVSVSMDGVLHTFVPIEELKEAEKAGRLAQAMEDQDLMMTEVKSRDIRHSDATGLWLCIAELDAKIKELGGGE